MNADSSDDKD